MSTIEKFSSYSIWKNYNLKKNIKIEIIGVTDFFELNKNMDYYYFETGIRHYICDSFGKFMNNQISIDEYKKIIIDDVSKHVNICLGIYNLIVDNIDVSIIQKKTSIAYGVIDLKNRNNIALDNTIDIDIKVKKLINL